MSLVLESNLIGLAMICDSTQSAVKAEASSRWCPEPRLWILYQG